jgi:hypothetical protein
MLLLSAGEVLKSSGCSPSIVVYALGRSAVNPRGTCQTMTWDAQSALNDFRTVADLAGVRLRDGDIRIEELPAPHIAPSRLPVGMMAVYVFSRGDVVLKVGKVGPNIMGGTPSSTTTPAVR